ncbi:uncharacterized protein EKO05_0004353 [Ascochyta rabiei]|uniref:uncharacterized protein n=1 Tax=Didymella rabiei TaxID=5454 RepID=UPI00220FDFEB|nr:uncharacterized protein EKO05_0004353 [Ascochyta rabiei]UPX13856.1 hypothetical protein EKO05_0004353 [Ascochyta rabiei]
MHETLSKALWIAAKSNDVVPLQTPMAHRHLYKHIIKHEATVRETAAPKCVEHGLVGHREVRWLPSALK